MELSHSLILNEDALAKIPLDKRPVFIFEWLRFLDKVLVAAQESDIRGCQKKIVEQLLNYLQESPGPPTRKLIARCLATLFSVGDTFLLFDTVNKCNDLLKNKDDSPSFLATKHAAICCLGTMYEKLGRMMGRSYEETVQLLIRALRNAESQTRIEIMLTLAKVCAGMGTAVSNVYRDMYKCAKQCVVDRVMAVRCAAARLLLALLHSGAFLGGGAAGGGGGSGTATHMTAGIGELETLATLCFRAFDGSNYEVRCAVARVLGALIAQTQQYQGAGGAKAHGVMKETAMAAAAGKSASGGGSGGGTKGTKLVSLDEVLGVLMSGFLRGGAGFLKGPGEIIKGGSGVNRDVRVGVTHSYVVFVNLMGSVWLERNITALLTHVLQLVANPKAASSHVDAVYSRKCCNFILRSVLGKMLGEKAQASACREIAQLVQREMNAIDFNPENAKDLNQETLFSQHLLVCALQEIGSLVLALGTSAQDVVSDPSLNIVDITVSVLIHPCQAARLAAAWCLRCICVAVPSYTTPMVDRFVSGIEEYRTSPEAVAGYSSALAAVIGGVHLSRLGIPHTKGKVIFNTAEELLRSASQNSRLSLHRTQAGWLLIGAIMTMGVSVVRGLLARMLLLLRNSFPRSHKELESEKARGDSFTWQVTLEGRAGALSTMHSFLLHCPELVTDDIIRRLLTPIESALAMLANISNILKSYGQQLKPAAVMVRLRLYETLMLLPAQSFVDSYTHLLRMLVAEFTLTENPANTTTSLLRAMCHADESIILGTWLQDTDHRKIEDQLQMNSAAGSGALEHDRCCLYRAINLSQRYDYIPGPLPLGVAVIDMSVELFGQIFPRVANKHRLQMLEHFGECIKHSKSQRQEAVQINIFAAILSGFKGLIDTKTPFCQDDVRRAATQLIIGALTVPNTSLRCAAGEAVGRLAQVVADFRFTAELAQTSFDRLKLARDVASRTGHSLALGCLHKYVGGMGSSQHLSTSVSILLALAHDQTSPVVQVWSLHALALIADSGGPMFRGYIEPALALALKLLLQVPRANSDVHQCVGKVLSALITTIGPELQGNTESITMARQSFLCACAIMQDHQDPLVQAEATGCLQQLHLFAPKHVNLSSLVPTLCRALSSDHLLLRKAAIACLRQLSQREAKEVCEHAMSLANEGRGGDGNGSSTSNSGGTATFEGTVEGLIITETGLPGVMFAMLDTEIDPALIRDIHDTLNSMLQMLAADHLALWLGLCKDVLTVATDATTPGTNNAGSTSVPVATGVDDRGQARDESFEPSAGEASDDDDEPDDDSAEFPTSAGNATGRYRKTHPAVQPRWPTRVYAAECVRKVIATCVSISSATTTSATTTTKTTHFDLSAAKEVQFQQMRDGSFTTANTTRRMDSLVLHLSDLVRMAFMAATSNSDPLRLAGLRTLQDIIERFARVPEPEFPGHYLLEQYQAQVGAALSPAFVADTSSHVTAAACDVCSTWIASNVIQDPNDLRRVHHLLVTSLGKLQTRTGTVQLYNESSATLERLAILKAWAEVYVVAMQHRAGDCDATGVDSGTAVDFNVNRSTSLIFERAPSTSGNADNLLRLVRPELGVLSTHWLAALKDHALLSLPAEFASQLPHDGGAFYTNNTMDASRPYYACSWPPILHASALWLNSQRVAGRSSSCNDNVAAAPAVPYAVTPDDDTSNNNSVPNNDAHAATVNAESGGSDSDMYHLLFGICMEALCSPFQRAVTPSTIVTSLRALKTLLDHSAARHVILGTDGTLSIELCNVMHRLLLTQDTILDSAASANCASSLVGSRGGVSVGVMMAGGNDVVMGGGDVIAHQIQLLCMAVVNLIVRASRERLNVALDEGDRRREVNAEHLGEGGATGDIVPGKSLVFAVLEICLCLIVRHLPVLSPSATECVNGGSSYASNALLLQQLRLRAANQPPTMAAKLVAVALQCMEGLHLLCSPRGAVTILPTILYLVTGVIKEMGTKSVTDDSILANNNGVQASLHCLKVFTMDTYCKDDNVLADWKKVLQSALIKIIDLAKTGSDETKLDEVTMMLAIAVFTLNAPSSVTSAPHLQYPCINHFRQCLQSPNKNIRLKCIQTLRSIFSHASRSVTAPYIHALAPKLVETLYVEKCKPVTSEQDLTVVREVVATIESLIGLAQQQHRIQLLSLIVPILINFLLDAHTASSASKLARSRHEFSLQWLMKIGPTYPDEFKHLIAQYSDLRTRLEKAIRANQVLGQKSSTTTLGYHGPPISNLQQRLSLGGTGGSAASQMPSIKLKTDFSNFS